MPRFILLTKFAEFLVLQLEVVLPEPLADSGALRPQTPPPVVFGAVGRVRVRGDVRLVRVFIVRSAAAARERVGDVAEPEGREEGDAAGEEPQEHDARRQHEQTVLSHRRRRRRTTRTSLTTSPV